MWGVWKKGLCVKMEVEVGCVEAHRFIAGGVKHVSNLDLGLV